MSIKVMTEVWESAPVTQGSLLVLLALADSADERSRECWPSVRHLAERARLSERQVQYVLKELAEAGVIEITANAGRGGSNLYRITKASEWGVQKLRGGEVDCTGGVKPTSPGGVKPIAPEPSYRTVSEPSLFPSSDDDAPASMQKKTTSKEQIDGQFESFWKHYPKKVEKAGARAKFEAAVRKGVDPARIVAAAARYAKSDQVARGFVKHPTTWLNQGCWDDELPAASGAAVASPDAEVARFMASAEAAKRDGSWITAAVMAVQAEKLAAERGVQIDAVAVQRFKLWGNAEKARQRGDMDRSMALMQQAQALGGAA